MQVDLSHKYQAGIVATVSSHLEAEHYICRGSAGSIELTNLMG